MTRLIIPFPPALKTHTTNHKITDRTTALGYVEFILPFIYIITSQPNTAIELQHTLFGVTLRGKLYLAPIEDNPEHVLDIATGD